MTSVVSPMRVQDMTVNDDILISDLKHATAAEKAIVWDALLGKLFDTLEETHDTVPVGEHTALVNQYEEVERDAVNVVDYVGEVVSAMDAYVVGPDTTQDMMIEDINRWAERLRHIASGGAI